MEERSEAIRLGRYGIRCPLVLERLEWNEISGEVIYRARPGRHDVGGESVVRWDVLEFLARVLDHPQHDWGHSLPDPSQQLLRDWGWHSNVARGRRERHQVEASAAPRTVTDPADAESRQRRLTWLWPQSYWGSQLIRKVYEIDPRLCPYCGATMRITVPPVVLGVAFLIDFASLASPTTDSEEDPIASEAAPGTPEGARTCQGPWPPGLAAKSNLLHDERAHPDPRHPTTTGATRARHGAATPGHGVGGTHHAALRRSDRCQSTSRQAYTSKRRTPGTSPSRA